MRQTTLAEGGFAKHHKITRKAEFLAKMERIVPWGRLVRLIEKHYPNPQGAGRRPKGAGRMLRVYFLQQWYRLSDRAMEEALYDMALFRAFAGFDLGEDAMPDETTICRFRHFLEAHDLPERIFECVGKYLEESGVRMSGGTMVDATLIAAPTSTKNRERCRDKEMRSTKKGGQSYFGMKIHLGTDSRTRVVHSMKTTPANVHDSQCLGDLLHGKERRVYGDSAYRGQGDVLRKRASRAQDYTHARAYRNRPLTPRERRVNRTKSRVRCRVEHVFGVMKCQFGYRKTRYKGLAKNTHQIWTLCALVNLTLAKKQLLRASPA